MSSSEEVHAAHVGEMPCRRLFALPRSGVAAACGSTQAGAYQGDPFRARVTTAGATSGRRRPMRTVPVIDALAKLLVSNLDASQSRRGQTMAWAQNGEGPCLQRLGQRAHISGGQLTGTA